MNGKHYKLTGEERLILVRAKVQRARKHLHDLEVESETVSKLLIRDART
jgi:hypothetical protein